MNGNAALLIEAKTAAKFIDELLGIHIIIPNTELAAEALRVLCQLESAISKAKKM
jgi:hypothetical protein